MDIEKLRDTYNHRFSHDQNWISGDHKKAIKVAARTIEWIRKGGYTKKSVKLLDVGCGNGIYSEAFRLRGCSVTGLDYSEVAVSHAARLYPSCRFIHMNGFQPVFNESFDVIFCKGFSGSNTHDLAFIADWINKYMLYLDQGGFFVLSYTTDFTGIERESETINLTYDELDQLKDLIHGKFSGLHFFYYFGMLSRLKKYLTGKMFGKKSKAEYYMLFRKE